MVDQVANFKKITVSTGYDDAAVSIVLEAGQGAELPDPSGDNYNLVWWDSTNYPDPADDPNVEIVRVTAKSTDTLTVTRNQEGSGASTKNTGSATYLMILSLTANTITDLIADVERTATVIVGKSGHVDYLTTDYGSDDACIQAAIDYVNGLGGGSVLIREGTYTLTTTVTLCSNLLLSGVGLKTKLVASGITTRMLYGLTKTHITISDMRIDGNDVDLGTGLQFETNCTDIIIERVYIENCGSSDGKTPTGLGFGTCQDIIISNCIFDDNYHYGITLSIVDKCVVNGCISKNNGRHGFGVGGTSQGDSSNISLTNNVAYTNGRNGFWCRTCDYLVLSNNVIDTSTDYMGINLEDIRYATISTNTIKNCGQHGIQVDNSVGVSQEITISGNYVLDCKNVQSTGAGIVINSPGGESFNISNNIINDAVHGIEISDVTNFNISNNNIENILRNGVNIWLGEEGVIEGNIIKNCGKELVANQQAGISLNGNTGDKSGHIVISNNRCYDDQGTKTQEYGIQEQGTSDYNEISNNLIFGNDTIGVSIVGTFTTARNNLGFNPIGAVGPPSLPASTNNYTNVYGYPCQVQVYGGTVTEIDIDDIATGLTSGIFMIPPIGTINITYSAAPSWRWWGL